MIRDLEVGSILDNLCGPYVQSHGSLEEENKRSKEESYVDDRSRVGRKS